MYTKISMTNYDTQVTHVKPKINFGSSNPIDHIFYRKNAHSNIFIVKFPSTTNLKPYFLKLPPKRNPWRHNGYIYDYGTGWKSAGARVGEYGE